MEEERVEQSGDSKKEYDSRYEYSCCDICEGIESNSEGKAPYVEGGAYCDC